MWNDFLHSFVPSSSAWHGRVRAMQLCAPILEEISKRSLLPLVPVPTWILPASVGWEFVEQNQLKWAIDTDVEDEIIRREFLRQPLPEPVRAELRTFLQNRLPGLLLVDAVFKGEDMGITPYPHLFPRKYVVDPNSSLVERLRVLEQSIKELMSMVFFAESKMCFAGILLPLEDWMVSISVAEVNTQRRGSFYYPDMTAVVWSGEGADARGLLVPGWWEPRHPHFPTPVAFTPGGVIGPGPAHLLALETKMGSERMLLIPRHLAKTHGTMNLTTVSEEHEVQTNGVSSRSTTDLVAGESSPLSDLTAELIETLTAEMQIPLGLQMLVQPDMATGKSCVALLAVRPHTPPSLRRPIQRPITGLFETLLEGCPSRGQGAAFARYILIMEKDLQEEDLPGLLHTLRSLEGMGESALILSHNPLEAGFWDLVMQSRAVVAVCAPNGIDRVLREGLLHFRCDCAEVRMDHLRQRFMPLSVADGLPWYVVPKPLRMTVEDGIGAAWL
ncbi:hypothetical protein KJ612_06455 [Myxococcota bacterium]|nr:hypothetical protein [Myxococcota bacterium]